MLQKFILLAVSAFATAYAQIKPVELPRDVLDPVKVNPNYPRPQAVPSDVVEDIDNSLSMTWKNWFTTHASSSNFNLIKKSFISDLNFEISSYQLSSAYLTPQAYEPTDATKAFLKSANDSPNINLIALNEFDQKVDPAFAKGSAIDTRVKWANHIYEKMKSLATNRKDDEMILVVTGGLHCSDFYLRNLFSKDPKLTQIAYTSQFFSPKSVMGSSEYVRYVKEQSDDKNLINRVVQTMSERPAGYGIPYISEKSLMQLIVRHYGSSRKAQMADLRREVTIDSPKFVCYSDIHASIKNEDQVWMHFPDARELTKHGIKKVSIYVESSTQKNATAKDLSIRAYETAPDGTVVLKSLEMYRLMERALEWEAGQLKVNYSGLAAR